MLSMNYIKEEQNYYEQKIKKLIEKDEYNIRRNQRQQKEIERLNNTIDELEECFGKNYFDFNDNRYEKMKRIFERR